VNVGETVVYDAVKDYLISSNKMKDGIQCHLLRFIYILSFSLQNLLNPNQSYFNYTKVIYLYKGNLFTL